MNVIVRFENDSYLCQSWGEWVATYPGHPNGRAEATRFTEETWARRRVAESGITMPYAIIPDDGVTQINAPAGADDLLRKTD